jgi:hypothetical protein
MEYLFTAAGNPAYHFFTIKFFTEGGVDFVDQYMDSERAQAVFRQLSPKKPKTKAEEIFCEYFGRRQESHPQALLNSRWMLEEIYGKIDAAKMRELESLLPAESGQKLVFTKQEVARQISDFYTIALRVALRDDLEDGSQRVLSRHVQISDDEHLPSFRDNREKYEEAVRAFVEKLLLWVNQITPEGVSEDIEKVLSEHEKTLFSTHMRRLSTGPGRKDYLWCEHTSKYVLLDGNPHDDGIVSLSLKASRQPIYDELDSGPYTISPAYKVEPKHD